MKMTGAEWREFEATGWPEGYIWADDSVLDDGRDLYVEAGDGAIVIADGETFVVPSFWSMVLEDATPNADGIVVRHSADKGDGMDMRAMVRRWRKARDNETVIVTVPKADLEAFRALMAERKWGYPE